MGDSKKGAVGAWVIIRNTETTETRRYRDDYFDPDPNSGSEYVWSEGNFSCDCNRALAFARSTMSLTPKGNAALKHLRCPTPNAMTGRSLRLMAKGTQMSKLTIIRGLPGSGKTTLAKSYPCLHVEADMFFQRDDKYQWAGPRVKEAHTWCQSVTRLALAYGADVVVSNTFTTLKEMEPYLGMTWDNLEVIKCVGQFESVHEVPQEVLGKMKSRWQDYEGEVIYDYHS